MILVTGATGHIGNVLVKKLRSLGEDVRIMLLPHDNVLSLSGLKLDIVCGDIRNPEDVTKAVNGCDMVYHLAGMISIHSRKSAALEDINITGTRNVVNACLENHIKRLIYVSSVHALPEPPNGQPICETEQFPALNLRGDYAISKSAATAEVYKGIRQGLDAVILFPSGIIGPYDFKRSEMGRLIEYMLKRRQAKVLFFFDGSYDFVDVRDVAEALIEAASGGRPGQGYILSGHNLTIKSLFEMVKAELKSDARLFRIPLWMVKAAAEFLGLMSILFGIKSLITPYSIDVLLSNSNMCYDKANSELGYSPRPAEITIRDSVQWMLSFISAKNVKGLSRFKHKRKMFSPV